MTNTIEVLPAVMSTGSWPAISAFKTKIFFFASTSVLLKHVKEAFKPACFPGGVVLETTFHGPGHPKIASQLRTHYIYTYR